jgi:prepilin-type processing-associated H-X9-DG protein
MKTELALSLVELLVVIAVIAIVAALLLSTLQRSKSSARAASCLNNLKQWGVATLLYAAENRDYLPKDGFATPTLPAHFVYGWYIQLPQTIGIPTYPEMPWRTNAATAAGRSLWLCPANNRRSNGNLLFHYCLNQHVNGTGKGNRPVQLSRFSTPHTIVWLFDSKNLPAVGTPNYVHTNLHARGAQFLFLDGHVKRFRSLDYWDSSLNKAKTNHPDLVWYPQ